VLSFEALGFNLGQEPMRMRLGACLVLAAAAAWAGTARDELLALRAKLAADKLTDRPSAWAAELKFAAAHRADPALAAEVMYDVAVAQARREPHASAKTFQDLVDAFPAARPYADLATYELAKLSSDRSLTRPKAIELFEKVLQLKNLDPVRRADALLSLGRLQLAASNNPQAIAHFKAFVEQFPDRTSQCAEALASMGNALVELKRPKEAYECYQKLAATYAWEVERRRNLLLAIGLAFRTSQDHEGAAAVYEKLLDELPKADSRRAQAYMGLAMLYAQQNSNEKAVEIYKRMATDRAVGASYQATASRQLFQLQRQANDNAGIIRLAQELIAAQPAGVLDSTNILGDLVDAFINEGRTDEALAMGRACFRLTLMAGANSSEAVLSVVRAFKAREGSLRSANAYIAFVENGPEGPDGKLGTADDLKDPTAAVSLPAEPERDRLFGAAAKRFITEPLQLGYLYICWDKPDEALRAFRRYYLDTFETSKLQPAVAVLTRAMRALGRSEAEVDAFFDYQNYGPAGKDGRPKTADDLRDPLLPKK